MRKLLMWNVITLDGCFEGEKSWDLSFHGLVWGDELEAFCLEQLHEADMIVFGKDTYQGMADYWTDAQANENDPEIAPIMNSITKIVCSSTLEKAEWNNTTIARNAAEELARIKQEGNGSMYIFGSTNLSESLMNAGLIDEIRLCIAPTILGKGRKLFTDQTLNSKLQLLEAKSLTNGGVLLRYNVLKG